MDSTGDGVRTKLALIPIGIGAALISFGLWMYAFPGAVCVSAGYYPLSSPCPVPSSYYVLPNTLLAIGAVAIALGLAILISTFLRHRKAPSRSAAT
jgi:hypothetical protein